MSMDKLIRILKKNNVTISKSGNVCWNDFMEIVINSNSSHKNNPNDNIYVEPEFCIVLIKKGESKKCKEIWRHIKSDINNERKEQSEEIMNLKLHKSENERNLKIKENDLKFEEICAKIKKFDLNEERNLKIGENDLKIKELDTKIKKLDLETQMAMLKLDLETQLILQKLEKELQSEKIKYLTMKKGTI